MWATAVSMFTYARISLLQVAMHGAIDTRDCANECLDVVLCEAVTHAPYMQAATRHSVDTAAARC